MANNDRTAVVVASRRHAISDAVSGVSAGAWRAALELSIEGLLPLGLARVGQLEHALGGVEANDDATLVTVVDRGAKK